MKPSSQPLRTPSKLSDSVHAQLNMYALAASAAGVGMMALAQPAEARIVYTPAHRHVLLNHPLGLDLNHDGIVDFRIGRYHTGSRSGTGLFARGDENLVAGHSLGTGGSTIGQAYALNAGKRIGSSNNFKGSFMADRYAGTLCFGAWNNVTKRYLGLAFLMKGKWHYGWARLNESCNLYGRRGTGAQALLTGYAYETIPNKPIITGKTKGPDVITLEPGSLGALAAGASGRNRQK